MKISRVFFSFFVGIIFLSGNSFCGIKNNGPVSQSMLYAYYHQVDCFVTIGNEKKIDFLTLSNGNFFSSIECKGFGPEASINCIELIDKETLCAGLSDGSIWTISISDGKLTELQASCSNAITALRYIGKNQILVAYKDGLVSLFGLKSKKSEISTFFADQTIIGMEKRSGVNNSDIIICSTHGLFVWDYVQKNKLVKLSEKFNEQISAFSKWDNNIFVVGFVDGTFCFCNIKNNTVFNKIKMHNKSITSLLRHNNALFSASDDGIFKIYGEINKLNLNEKKLENTEQCNDSQDEDEADEDMNDLFKIDIDEN